MYAQIARRFGTERIAQLLGLLGELESSLEEISQEQAPNRRRRSSSR
jgi:hypothetical protein